jgi:hypothetical protein
VLAEFLQHLKDCGEFLFRKHADLKPQMRAPVRLASHSTLADQHEDSQKHAFGRNNQRQDAEWKWIKCRNSRDHAKIYQHPTGNQDQLRQQKCRIADNFAITSLTRSVGLVRSSASCSSLAIASMLCRVGFAGAPGGIELFMG